jgi:hypothetical protein
MKELGPGSTGRSEIRVLFAFDVERKAILLVGGDKYEANIPVTDQRFDEHQGRLQAKQADKTTRAKRRRNKGKGSR